MSGHTLLHACMIRERTKERVIFPLPVVPLIRPKFNVGKINPQVDSGNRWVPQKKWVEQKKSDKIMTVANEVTREKNP